MFQREREERLEGKMFFWGKVEGNENDYLVCYALATPKLEQGDFPQKKVSWKYLNTVKWMGVVLCRSSSQYCTERLSNSYIITKNEGKIHDPVEQLLVDGTHQSIS